MGAPDCPPPSPCVSVCFAALRRRPDGFYLEHRARIAILKAAVDYALKGSGGSLKYAMLPESFRAALEKLQAEPHFGVSSAPWLGRRGNSADRSRGSRSRRFWAWR